MEEDLDDEQLTLSESNSEFTYFLDWTFKTNDLSVEAWPEVREPATSHGPLDVVICPKSWVMS